MRLDKAANYFNDTPVDGWNGVNWINNVMQATLLPYDRFIAERAFGLKRRMLMVKANETALDYYPVIRLPSGDIYMVGAENSDIDYAVYSRVFMIHRAAHYGELFGFVKTLTASGMPGSVARSSIGTTWCDVERITSSNSKEFDNVTFSQVQIILPRNTVVDTEHELSAGGKFYDIKESIFDSGFWQCRAVMKRSS